MVHVVFLCLSMTFSVLLCQSMESTLRYECGRHGRFEYCIDGIPGCVVGCHCHPGYYFDTETKICEPNLKLTEDFKRRLMLDPNRIYPVNTPTLLQNIPTQTTTNTINDRIDDMSKDDDDIGEWLYNQFFKTIETQVINSTNDAAPMTRRNMNDVFSVGDNDLRRKNGKSSRGNHKNMEDGNAGKTKKKVKTRKSRKSRGKKSKSKVHGLRRKLLRISEDDSLFDSDSGSESDDEDSSSSSSSESASHDDRIGKDDKDDHGHKKVIIFNRRPRPPLPSFIFLPNMDTPYYPPIGLPPPPIMPMYPMVPIPPMAPYPPSIGNGNCSDTTTSKPSETTTENEEKASVSTDPPTEDEDNDITTTTETTILRSGKRSRSKIHKERKPPPTLQSEEMLLMRSRDLDPSELTPKQLERLHLVNSLKERLKMKKKLENLHNHEVPDDNSDLFGGSPAVPQPKHPKSSDRNLNDVNFKYLSQLIHHGKNNDTTISQLPADHNEKNLENIEKTRRFYDQQIPIINYEDQNITPTSPIIKDPDDAYFMKLGRQIASLIRDEDLKQKNKATDTPKVNSLQESINAILNENQYSTRSYWERFVRSPLSRLKSYLVGLHYYNEDNDMNLFSLEDEVKTIASTTKPLTLRDIENLLTSVQKANSELNNTVILPKHSEVSFNVNLLPRRDMNHENHHRRMYEVHDHFIPSPSTGNKHDALRNNNTHYLEPKANVYAMPKMSNNYIPAKKSATIQPYHPGIESLIRNTQQPLENNHLNRSSLRYFPINAKKNKMSRGEYLKFLKKIPVVVNPNANKSKLNKYPDLIEDFTELPAKYNQSPDKSKSSMKNNNLNYFSGRNKQHFLFEASYPVHMSPFKQSFSKRIDSDKPSYFHHEFHHFDYFD